MKQQTIEKLNPLWEHMATVHDLHLTAVELGDIYQAAEVPWAATQAENAILREQRDSAWEFIYHVGDMLGVKRQEHKSAHGFKVLEAIRELLRNDLAFALECQTIDAIKEMIGKGCSTDDIYYFLITPQA